MQVTEIHRERAARLRHDPTGPKLMPVVDGYLAAVKATPIFNGGFLSFDLTTLGGGIRLNADEAYGSIESAPDDSYANVEVDAGLQPDEMRRFAYALLVHADEIEGR